MPSAWKPRKLSNPRSQGNSRFEGGNSPILLLDEATASLDIENELAVKRAILGLLSERKTVIMIAHTLSIVRNADQILVVADGNIAESGTHEELLARGGKYAAMWAAEQRLSN